jgi:CcmD family protein
MRHLRIFFVLLLALAGVPAARTAHAQADASTTMTAAPATQAPEAGAFQGPPRTLRAYWHLFAAFTIVWLLVFGYLVTLARRFRRMEEQLQALGG